MTLTDDTTPSTPSTLMGQVGAFIAEKLATVAGSGSGLTGTFEDMLTTFNQTVGGSDSFWYDDPTTYGLGSSSTTE